MAFVIRPYTDADAAAYLRLLNQAMSAPVSLSSFVEREARLKSRNPYRYRVVGELDGQLVAYAYIRQDEIAAIPGWLRVEVLVDAAHQRQGWGRRMAEAVESAVATLAPAGLDAFVLDNDPDTRAWAERRGFTLHAHRFSSTLPLDRFDPTPFAGAVARTEATGLRFVNMADLRGEAKWQRLYELFARLLMLAPDCEGSAPMSYGSFRALYAEHPDLVPAATIVAVDGDEWVGMTLSIRRGDRLYTEFTGTDPAYRGRGLALALKLLAIDHARHHEGYAMMYTHNLSINAPMLAVNRRLGYEPQAGIWWLRRAL